MNNAKNMTVGYDPHMNRWVVHDGTIRISEHGSRAEALAALPQTRFTNESRGRQGDGGGTWVWHTERADEPISLCGSALRDRFSMTERRDWMPSRNCKRGERITEAR